MIALVIFSLRVMFGAVRTQGIAMMFVAKLVFVIYMSNPANVLELYKWRDAFIEFPQTISWEVLQAVESPITKDKNQLSEPGDLVFREDDVFDYFDRYAMYMLGVEQCFVDGPATEDCVTDRGDREQVYIGLAALVSAFLFTEDIGASIALVALIYALSIIFAMAQAVLFFCTVIVAINFLIAIAPLAAACILFNSTKRITQLWLNYLIVYTIQPILLMAFLGLILGLISQIVKMPDLGNPEDLGEGLLLNKFWKTYKDVRHSYGNPTGTEVREIKLLDCKDIVASAGGIAQMAGKSAIWGNLYSRSISGDAAMDGVTSGNAYQNILSSMEDDNCEVTVNGLVLKENFLVEGIGEGVEGAEQYRHYLTEESLREFTGMQLAIIVIMTMLISFLVTMPKEIHRMVGTGVIPNIVQYATNPTEQFKGGIERTSYSARRYIRQMMNNNTASR
jgi:hypothetical protein